MRIWIFYLEIISKNKNKEFDLVYKNQMDNYSTFTQSLVLGNKILSRRFYIIIPYSNKEENKDFNLIKEQISLTCDIIQKGLEKLGMKARVLDSLELLDLFYSFYNPEQSKTQELKSETVNLLLKGNYV